MGGQVSLERARRNLGLLLRWLGRQPHAEKLEAARNETIEQAEELQELIKQEIKQLQQQSGLGRLLPGHTRNRTADLANLAAALKDAAAARMMALGGIEPDYE